MVAVKKSVCMDKLVEGCGRSRAVEWAQEVMGLPWVPNVGLHRSLGVPCYKGKYGQTSQSHWLWALAAFGGLEENKYWW